jgi:hypothetical protein
MPNPRARRHCPSAYRNAGVEQHISLLAEEYRVAWLHQPGALRAGDRARLRAERRSAIPGAARNNRGNDQAMRQHQPLLVSATFMIALIVLELAGILQLNQGLFVYTLDDPYIHLALAENLARGHYGVNGSEASAPSSSILWPYLLAPFALTSAAPYVPFILNVAFAVATLLVYARVASTALEKAPPMLAAWLLIVLLLATNVIGLVFTGMEHSLQLLLAATVALGMARESQTGRAPAWFAAAIVLGPLVRYESLALSVASIAYLFLRRRFALAGALLVATLLPLAAFSLYLVSLDLAPLPSSVLAKSQVASDQSHVAALLENLKASLRHDRGVAIGVCMLVLIARALFEPRSAPRLLAIAGAGAIAMHLLAGQYGWYSRYEIYVWSFALLSLLVVFGERLRTYFSAANAVRLVLLSAAALGLICFKYLHVLQSIPLAANNIYQQQYQMHRFAVDFHHAPVAVNDLGYVSWRNDVYVLDLWGLASLSALRLRSAGSDRGWMDALVRRHGVELAMIYESWFADDIPRHWVKLGDLRLGRRKVTPAESRVTFYAVSPSAREEGLAQLRRFSRTLPPGVRFVFAADRAPAAQAGALQPQPLEHRFRDAADD